MALKLRVKEPGETKPSGVLAAHVHGPGCDHDHEGHGDDHHGHEGHVHGPGCDHDHGHDHGHGHGDGHDHHHEEIRAPIEKVRADGGAACLVDMAAVVPGETDAVGRFQKLEQALEGQRGISDIRFHKDEGYPAVWVDYDPKVMGFHDVVDFVKKAGAEISQRYLAKSWFVLGMASAQSSYQIENALSGMPGIIEANVAYAAERLVVEYDRESIKPQDIALKVKSLGFDLEEPQSGHACCAHAHGSGLASKLEIPLALGAGALLVLGQALAIVSYKHGVNEPWYALGSYLASEAQPPWYIIGMYLAAAVAAGFFAVRGAFNSLLMKKVDIETLMVLGAVGAAFIGEWFDAGLLLFLFSLGHALEHRVMERARKAINSLGKLRPETAFIKVDDKLTEVGVRDVRRGRRIFVRDGDRVPLDGVIRAGQSSLDQATITGESVPVSKSVGDTVYAGTINKGAMLEVEVTKISTESAIAKVINMVTEAEAQKSPTQRFAKKLEQKFVPIVLAAAPALFLVKFFFLHNKPTDAFLSALGLLVAASPCALAISTPSAVLSAVARAARGGVLMKGGAHLESLGKVAVIAFDKTGTLTVGKPKLVTVSTAPGVTESVLLSVAAAAESLSSHPLAKAVVDGASEKNIEARKAVGCEAVHGKGLRSSVDGEPVVIGTVELFETVPAAIRDEVERLQAAGQTTMVVRHGESFLGVLGVADTLRPEARGALAEIRALGISRTVMLSGDNLRVATAIAKQVGIDEPRAPLMPEGKVAALKDLLRSGGVAMVGDGVNDAPALATASVGIAMGGAGSDVALETADVVLMSDDLRQLPFAVGLARAATRTIAQNLTIALGVSMVLILCSVFPMLSIGIGWTMVLHEGSTMVVVLNGLRLLIYEP